jgi:hypothetical protein
MPIPAPRPETTEDPWLDAEGTYIPLQGWVEQVVVDETQGALPSRLHQQGQVIGQVLHKLYVHFKPENQVITLRPHLVRVIETPSGD